MNFKHPSNSSGQASRFKAPPTIRFDEVHAQSSPHQPKKAFLTVIRSQVDLGVHSFVNGPVVLGRDPDCPFPLHDHGVSWAHARISADEAGDYCIEDLSSTNGTKINGSQIVGPQKLSDGAKIFVGQTVLRFSLADEVDIDFHSEVETLVGTDPLTDLPSKRRFDKAFDFALNAARQRGESLGVLMMDMDGVKQINDTHGHLFGAHVIGETGRLIAAVIGSRGRACRFGGDEFSAFLPGLNLDQSLAIAEQIRVAVEKAGFEKDGIPLRPTISIGAATFPESTELLALVTAADAALYRAKGQGKNCVAA